MLLFALRGAKVGGGQHYDPWAGKVGRSSGTVWPTEMRGDRRWCEARSFGLEEGAGHGEAQDLKWCRCRM